MILYTQGKIKQQQKKKKPTLRFSPLSKKSGYLLTTDKQWRCVQRPADEAAFLLALSQEPFKGKAHKQHGRYRVVSLF